MHELLMQLSGKAVHVHSIPRVHHTNIPFLRTTWLNGTNIMMPLDTHRPHTY